MKQVSGAGCQVSGGEGRLGADEEGRQESEVRIGKVRALHKRKEVGSSQPSAPARPPETVRTP